MDLSSYLLYVLDQDHPEVLWKVIIIPECLVSDVVHGVGLPECYWAKLWVGFRLDREFAGRVQQQFLVLE